MLLDGSKKGLFNMIPFFSILFSIFLLDQATKILVRGAMPLGHEIPLLPFFSHLQTLGHKFDRGAIVMIMDLSPFQKSFRFNFFLKLRVLNKKNNLLPLSHPTEGPAWCRKWTESLGKIV